MEWDTFKSGNDEELARVRWRGKDVMKLLHQGGVRGDTPEAKISLTLCKGLGDAGKIIIDFAPSWRLFHTVGDQALVAGKDWGALVGGGAGGAGGVAAGADADGDGKLTLEEAKAAGVTEEQFKAMDADADGHVDLANEFQVEDLLADADGDGMLSLEEAVAAGFSKEEFMDMDADRSGTVSLKVRYWYSVERESCSAMLYV